MHLGLRLSSGSLPHSYPSHQALVTKSKKHFEHIFISQACQTPHDEQARTAIIKPKLDTYCRTLDMHCCTDSTYFWEIHYTKQLQYLTHSAFKRGRWSHLVLSHQVKHMETNYGGMNQASIQKKLLKEQCQCQCIDLLKSHSYKHPR